MANGRRSQQTHHEDDILSFIGPGISVSELCQRLRLFAITSASVLREAAIAHFLDGPFL